MHGRNESGKTTLMKYVRSMFFGYLRGDWHGYFGSMDIRREDGKEYKIVRNEKEYTLSDGDENLQEEPADLWWHGLDRQTYDKIFAMGLEDLQALKSCPMKPSAITFSVLKAASPWAWPAAKWPKRWASSWWPHLRGKSRSTPCSMSRKTSTVGSAAWPLMKMNSPSFRKRNGRLIESKPYPPRYRRIETADRTDFHAHRGLGCL